MVKSTEERLAILETERHHHGLVLEEIKDGLHTVNEKIDKISVELAANTKATIRTEADDKGFKRGFRAGITAIIIGAAFAAGKGIDFVRDFLK